MLETLQKLPDDPILGIMALYRADAHPGKIDLGVGVYRDERGETPVLECVRRAEAEILDSQITKAYVGPAGNPRFNAAIAELVLGAGHPALRDGRVRAVQTPGGCGALRVGAELLRAGEPRAVVHLSDPTWANHRPLLSGSGIELSPYPYYDAPAHALRTDAMLETLRRLPPGRVVLVHGSCHNPTGADLALEDWHALTDIVLERRLVPFVDLAYQGLGDGLDADAAGLRHLLARAPEGLVAVSCSKNFGLYRERVGALVVSAATPAAADAAQSHLQRIARGIYSMPPDHGATVVERILASGELRTLWLRELEAMRGRIMELRERLATELARACPGHDFSFLARQRGMFSLLAIAPPEVERLRTEHHVYMAGDSRFNVAGLNLENLPRFARAVAPFLAK